MRRCTLIVLALLGLAAPASAQAVIVPAPVPTCSNGNVLQWSSSGSNFVCASVAAAAQPFDDSLGLLANHSDATKVLKFSVAAITTGTTRTWTIPDANITVPSTIASLGTNTFTGLQTLNGGLSATTAVLSGYLSLQPSALASVYVSLNQSSTFIGGIGSRAWWGDGANGDFAVGAGASRGVYFYTNNSTAARGAMLTSGGFVWGTGLTAVDPGLSNFGVGGTLYAGWAGAGGGTIQIGPTAPSTNGSGYLYFINSNSVLNWMISSNGIAASAFEITPSSANGGQTFTTPKFSIRSDGHTYTDNGSVYSLSDKRSKDRVRDFTPGLAAVLALAPAVYHHKKDLKGLVRSDEDFVGVTAQEMIAAFPDAAGTPVQDAAGNTYQTMTMQPLLYGLVNATKELNTYRLADEQRLATLEAAVKQLQAQGVK